MSISAVGAIGMPATRIGDDIAHTMARFGLFAGMLAGALLVAATVATGGAALVVVGAAVAAGAAGGGLIGMAVGGMYMGPPTGKLVIGSPNVMINNRPATMTFLAAAACGHHPGPPIPVATGSATVMINNGYAAREGETMGCSAVIIANCSPDVIIGGESVQDPRVEIKPEIPDWVVDTLKVVAIAGAIIATGGAVAAAMAGGATFAGAAGTVAMGVGRGILTSAATGAVGSRIGYAIDGERGAIAGGAIGGMVGLPGRRMAGAFNRRYKVTTQGMGSNFGNVRIQRRLPTKAQFGTSTSNNYKNTFFKANPTQKGKVVVHHAVEQQVQRRFPNLVKDSEMHSLKNLRGIPKSRNSDLHLSKIRKDWNRFYRQNPSPTKQQLLDKATEIDTKYGHLFDPPLF